MSLYEKIKALGVEDDVSVTFEWEEGCDVMHYNETHVETAMSNTGAAYALAEAITEGVFYEKGNEILDEITNKPDDKWYNTQGAIKYTELSKKTLDRAVQKGLLKVSKVTGKNLYRKSHLDKWLDGTR